MDTRVLVLELLRKTKLAVISTVGEDAPESAVLEFAETEDLELIFDTLSSSRKYRNLQKNHNASFVIGWDDNLTVQYEGIVQELLSEELERYKQIYFKKNPKAKRWEHVEGIRYFKVTPRWIRYSDLNQHPWDIKEIKF